MDISGILQKKPEEILKKSKLDVTNDQILDDDHIAEIAMSYNFDFENLSLRFKIQFLKITLLPSQSSHQ